MKVDKTRGMNVSVVHDGEDRRGSPAAAAADRHAVPAELTGAANRHGNDREDSAQEQKTLKFKVRHRNRCQRCGRPRALPAQVRAVPSLLPQAGARGRRRGRDQEQLVGARRARRRAQPECRVPEPRETEDMTDPIADMLTRIRNAVTARHARVDMPASKLKAEIARILAGRGLHRRASRWSTTPAERPASAARSSIRMFLKYGPRGERVITGIERVSRPGRRVYFGRDEVPTVLGGLGTSILTTSRGVMTGREAAQGRRRRRSALQRLVRRVGRQPCLELERNRSRFPKGVHRQGRRRRPSRCKGPKGKLTPAPSRPASPSRSEDGAARRRARRATTGSSASSTAWRAASSPTPCSA